MKRTARHSYLIHLGLICTVGLACPRDDDDDVTVDTEPTTTVAVTTIDTEPDDDTEVPIEDRQVRVVHAIAGAPDVDVYVTGEDTARVTNLSYGEASDYFDLPEGENRIELRLSNNDNDQADNDDRVLIVESLELRRERTTAVAAGRFVAENQQQNQQQDQQDLRLLVFEEQFGDPADNQARIRVIHAGPDAPAINVDVSDDGTTDLQDLSQFEGAQAAGVNVPAGEELQVAILENDERVAVFTVPELDQGEEMFLIATGLLEDAPRQETGFVLLPVTREGAQDRIRQNPRLGFLHASPNAPQMDVCANNMILAEGLSFEEGESLSMVHLRPDEHDLTLQEAGQQCEGPAIVQFMTPNLEAGEQYLAAIGGDFELIGPGDPENTLIVAITPEMFTLDAMDQAVIRLLHAAAAPSVVAGLVTNGSIADINVFDTDLGPGEQTGELPGFAAGDYTIGLSTDDTAPYQVLVQGDVQLMEGERSWIVIAGSAEELGNDDQQLRYRIVDSSERQWRVRDVQLTQP